MRDVGRRRVSESWVHLRLWVAILQVGNLVVISGSSAIERGRIGGLLRGLY